MAGGMADIARGLIGEVRDWLKEEEDETFHPAHRQVHRALRTAAQDRWLNLASLSAIRSPEDMLAALVALHLRVEYLFHNSGRDPAAIRERDAAGVGAGFILRNLIDYLQDAHGLDAAEFGIDLADALWSDERPPAMRRNPPVANAA